MKKDCNNTCKTSSKRLKNKNILKFLGLPLIVHTIKLHKSNVFDEIIVSTDSKNKEYIKNFQSLYMTDQKN